eukprot:TRINITY_DN5871_c0_g1_i1.p1 TRINITY_DN5871_c0_g1~~TRINITY_DN5871_c0_g1_i1.p1  ORF type:complete len:377 (+),score=48.98 TRINITY_DN5871_c0_g1_i1:255-1385(+)
MLGGLLKKFSGSNNNSPTSSPRLSWRSSSTGRTFFEEEQQQPNIDIISVIDTFVEPYSPRRDRSSTLPTTPSSPRKIITAILKRTSRLRESNDQITTESNEEDSEDLKDYRSHVHLIQSEGWFGLLPDEMRLEILQVLVDNDDWKSISCACRVNSRWNRELNDLWRKSFENRERDGISYLTDERYWSKYGRPWKWICIMMSAQADNAASTPYSFGYLKNSETNKLRFEGLYEGEWKGGNRHGIGRLWWTNQDRYIGQWREDKKNGSGTMIWANGDRYSGGWKDDLRHGASCKYTYAVGGIFKGTYHKDERHGPGSYTWPDGDRFIGEWKSGGRQGKGIFITKDGTRFHQFWKEDIGVSYSERLPNKYPPEEIPTSM